MTKVFLWTTTVSILLLSASISMLDWSLTTIRDELAQQNKSLAAQATVSRGLVNENHQLRLLLHDVVDVLEKHLKVKVEDEASQPAFNTPEVRAPIVDAQPKRRTR